MCLLVQLIFLLFTCKIINCILCENASIIDCLDEDPGNLTVNPHCTMRDKALIVIDSKTSILKYSETRPQLKIFKVQGLEEATLQPIMFKNLNSVEYIDLSDNLIKDFNVNVFINEDLQNLKHLEMHNNPLNAHGLNAWEEVKKELANKSRDTKHIHYFSIVTIIIGILIIIGIICIAICIKLTRKVKRTEFNKNPGYEVPGMANQSVARNLLYSNLSNDQPLLDLS